MGDQMIFKRYEIKYMLNGMQLESLKKLMETYMIADEHGESTNLSLYFDTPQFLLARRSMDHPMYKEKLRIRSYGVAKEDSTVFVEIKKKYDSVTYKRRISMKEMDMEDYLIHHKKIMDNQISREIDYCFKQYKNLKPAVMLSYDRQAFYAKDDHEFRITFDRNILWRDYDLSLTRGIYGSPILKDDQVVMEIKVAAAMPKWLVNFLTENKIYRTSFSKYSIAYRTMYEKNPKILAIDEEKLLAGKATKKDNLNGGIINYA